MITKREVLGVPKRPDAKVGYYFNVLPFNWVENDWNQLFAMLASSPSRVAISVGLLPMFVPNGSLRLSNTWRPSMVGSLGLTPCREDYISARRPCPPTPLRSMPSGCSPTTPGATSVGFSPLVSRCRPHQVYHGESSKCSPL